MKKTVLTAFAALVAMGAASTARAAEYAWTGSETENYSLGADDTLTIAGESASDEITLSSSSAKINSASTGTGTVEIKNCKLYLTYPIKTSDAVNGGDNPFNGFSGKVVVGENAEVYCHNDGSDWAQSSPFGSRGAASCSLEFRGGKVIGFSQAANVGLSNAINIPQGQTGEIENSRDHGRTSWNNGVNLTLSGALTGQGTLNVTQTCRWLQLTGNNTSFSGVFNYSKKEGWDTGGPYVEFASANAASADAAWSFDMYNSSFPVKLSHAANSTIRFGAFSVSKAQQITVSNSGTTIEIGNKADSSIQVPFAGNAATIKKTGAATTLTLGPAVALVSGSALDIAAGTLEADGANLANAAITSGSSSTFKVTARGATIAAGAAFGTVELAEGAVVTLAAPGSADGEYMLFTYAGKASGTAFNSTTVNVTGLSLSGNSTASISDDGSAVKLVIGVPTLVWGGNGSWCDAGAWQDASDSTKTYTFKAGDSVSIGAGSTVTLDGDVTVGDLTIAGDVTFAGSGKVAVKGTYASTGTLTLGDNAKLAFSGDGQSATSRTIAGGHYIKGAGEVVFEKSKTTLTYYVGDRNEYDNGANPFEGFTGTVVIGEDAYVDCQNVADGYYDGAKHWDESRSPFTKGPAIRFEGGTLRGFKQGNNVNSFNAIDIPEGKTGLIDDTLAVSGSGCNITFSRPFTGGGELSLTGQFRWMKFAADNSGFEGTLVYTNKSNDTYSYITFENANAGSAAAYWRIGTPRPVHLNHAADATIRFGALEVVQSSGIEVKNSGANIEIGGKAGVDSRIEVPFKAAATTLAKVGPDTTLTLEPGVTMVEGSTVAVEAGTLVVNAASLGASVTVANGATLAGTGTVAGVTFAAGAKVAALPDEPDTTKTYDIVTTTTKPSWTAGKPEVVQSASGKGKWRIAVRENDTDNDGTVDSWTLYSTWAPNGLVIIIR